jgi:nitric oxide reductase NorD protein
MGNIPLSAEQIRQRLERHLESVPAPRRYSDQQLQKLAELRRREQEFVLRWVGIISRSNEELACQFSMRAADALTVTNLEICEHWIVRAMDVYDEHGLYPALAVLSDARRYASELSALANGVALEEIAGVLQLIVHGLAGRKLTLAPAEVGYTDTSTLFLPQRLRLFAERRDNVRLYKAMAAHLWAQTWYGTFRLCSHPSAATTPAIELLLHVTTLAARFPDPTEAVRLFHALETVRLDARIQAELPGLYREMAVLQRKLGEVAYPMHWHPYLERLRRPAASVEDTCDIVPHLYGGALPKPLCYQGVLLPERVQQAMLQRIPREKEAFTSTFARATGKAAGAHHVDRHDQRPDLDRHLSSKDDALVLRLAGSPGALSEELQAVLASIIQDFGELPPDYLVPAGDEHGNARALARTHALEPASTDAIAFLYKEWDYRRQHYRKNWCTLRERDVHPLDDDFLKATLIRYRGLLSHLRRIFEALRGERKLSKKQKNGDDIDFDAAVEGYAETQRGMEMGERLFTKIERLERNIAVMFMVDMSGSTKGWVNEAEREALVLLCEALERLGDRYAIYGFSGMTRKRCELFRVKGFNEPYADAVKRRIGGIRPQDYTRMGVTIRHLTQLLSAVDARTKLLITLSDGKPDDYDGYGGDYGIEDTRQALIEAKQLGVYPFCITIDTEARDYLPHMYGAVNYTLVDDVRKLPAKVADIYRRLTRTL